MNERGSFHRDYLSLQWIHHILCCQPTLDSLRYLASRSREDSKHTTSALNHVYTLQIRFDAGLGVNEAPAP